MQEFKASDRKWLLNNSPPGSKAVWFGSPKDTGSGSIDRLVQTIKSGGITRGEGAGTSSTISQMFININPSCRRHREAGAHQNWRHLGSFNDNDVYM